MLDITATIAVATFNSSYFSWTRLVLSFFAGRGPTYFGPQRRDLYIGPVRQPRERRGIGRYERCMCTLCRVEEGTVGVSSLLGISNRAPSRLGLLSG